MGPETIGMLGTYGPIVIMVLIFYFLLYRPQKTEQKRRKNMLETLQKGNRVMTIGGIYGQISDIKEKTIKLKIAEHVEVEVARASISANVSHEKED
jgi:preprotein translocase subunit YajC